MCRKTRNFGRNYACLRRQNLTELKHRKEIYEIEEVMGEK